MGSSICITDWAYKWVGLGRAPGNVTGLAYSIRKFLQPSSIVLYISAFVDVVLCYAIVIFVSNVLVVIIIIKNDGLLSWLGRASV